MAKGKTQKAAAAMAQWIDATGNLVNQHEATLADVLMRVGANASSETDLRAWVRRLSGQLAAHLEGHDAPPAEPEQPAVAPIACVQCGGCKWRPGVLEWSPNGTLLTTRICPQCYRKAWRAFTPHTTLGSVRAWQKGHI